METLKKQAAKLLGEQKKYRRWLAVFLCLAMVVTAGTTAALKMNGQALSHEKKVLACSEEVHEHTAECYESGTLPGETAEGGTAEEEQPICGYADYVVHVHNEGCYGEDGELVCQIPEKEPHVHTEECYEKRLVLVCGQEETAAHHHTDACRELLCGQEEAEGHQHTEECREVICGQEETEAVQEHQHTEECRELLCGQEETEGHQHTEECITITQGDLICENTEEGHEHTAECYEQVETYTCGQEEAEAHTHTDECYGDYICGFEETEGTEGHTHTEECYGDYICGQEEGTEGHIHTEECYGDYICGLEETEGHIHTEECYELQDVLICGELELHTHTEECYDAEGSLICGIPELKEHVHGDECFEIIQVEDEDSNKLYQKVYEDANVRVTAEYMADANIPEEAELVAERVDAAGSAEENTAEGAEAGTEGSDESTEASTESAAESTESATESTEPAGEINEVAEVHEPEASESEADAQEADTTGSEADVQAAEGSETGSEASEAQADDAAADGSQDVSAAENASAAKTEIEIIEEKVTYRLKFLVDGTEIVPEGTVSFIVQGLDGEGNETGDLVTLVYKAGDGMDAMTVTLTLTKEISKVVEGQSGNQSFQKIYEDAEIRVTAEYAEDANIPENAELIAEKLEADIEVADESGETAAEDNAQEPVEDGSNVDVQEAESGELNETVEDNETDEAVPEDGEETAQENSADNEEDAVSVKTVKKEVSYRLKFLADGVEVEPEGTVTFTAQLLDGEGNGVGQPVVLTYDIGDGPDSMTVTLVKETAAEGQDEFVQVAEDGDVRVTVRYGRDANIPEDAEFKVMKLEEGSEEYQKCEEGYREAVDNENAGIGLALTIGFYVDGVEVEPEVPVLVTIQMLNGMYEEGEKLEVIHFGKEGTEKLDASDIENDHEGNQATSFEMSGFSDIAVGDSRTVVNFYVNLNSQIAANTDKQTSGSFSNSVKQLSVSGMRCTDGEDLPWDYQYQYTGNYGETIRRVIAASSDQNASKVDGLIRKLETGVKVPGAVTDLYGGSYNYSGDGTTYKITNFPSDSEVLANLRKEAYRTKTVDGKDTVLDIVVDGKVIDPNELTTDNYTIRWYSFHYNSKDKWHVDGVLVPKTAKIRVTKIFYGDSTAIAALKNNYSINLDTDGTQALSHRTIGLNEDNDELISVVTDLEGKTTTYTWELGVRPNKEYTINEQNYISGRTDIETMAQYNILPTGTGTAEYSLYADDTIKVTSGSYNADETQTVNYPTVNLKNSYLPNNSIHVFKYDATTGNGLDGVEFTLKKDGAAADVWYKDTDYYLYNPTRVDGVEKLGEDQNIAASNGNLTIYYNENSIGNYTLSEVVCPEDVDDQEMYEMATANFEIVKDGATVKVKPISGSTDGVELVQPEGSSSYTLNIPNKSKEKTITVQKAWADGTPQVAVEVKLFREPTAVEKQGGETTKKSVSVDSTNSNIITLSSDKGWSKTISVPVYVDGEEAVYSILETKIEETEYNKDLDKEDGYQYYKVTYANESSDNVEVLKVTNELDLATITFNKVDVDDTSKHLQGAAFALYTDFECTQPVENVANAKSSVEGVVSFENLKSVEDDSYYMKEVDAPEGYVLSDQIYKVTIERDSDGKKVGKIYFVSKDGDGNEVVSTTEISEITNEIKRLDGIQLKKVADQTGEVLKGAQFILSKTENEQTKYAVSVNDGIVSWETDRNRAYVFTEIENAGIGFLPKLEVGTYYLTEIKAPDGYHLLETTIGFVVESSGNSLSLRLLSNDKAELEGDDQKIISVSNSTGYALPETGGSGTTMYTLGGFAVIAASLMYGLSMRRKKEKGGSH